MAVSTIRTPRHTLILLVLVGFSLSTLEGCLCHDDEEYIWLFDEPEDPEEEDPEEPIREPEPPLEEPEDPTDWDWAFPDPEIEPEPPQWEETEWEIEVVAENIPRSFASDDRTSVIVDRQGTVWLGYHRCEDPFCMEPSELVVGHRRVGQTTFTWERIEAHSGLFGLAVIDANEPIVIYLHQQSRELRAALRQPNGRWLIEALPVESADAFDGFDVSRDRARFYVSHASHSRRRIEFFEYNTAAPVPLWRRLQPRENARSAAYERGLRGGNQLNFFLVHRDGNDEYRLSEYDLGRDEWTRSSVTYPGAISSLLVRQNQDICTAGPTVGGLRATCGSFDSPLSFNQVLHNRGVYYLSSLIENRAEDLFIAYHDGATQNLHLARKPAGGSFSTEELHPGETFGISTAIDHRDHLLMSFYYCPGSFCEIRLLERQR